MSSNYSQYEAVLEQLRANVDLNSFPPFVDEGDASEILNRLGCPMAPATMRKARCVGTDSPPWRKVGKFIRYGKDDLVVHAARRLSNVTAPVKAA